MLAIKSDIAKYHRLHTERAVAFQMLGVFFTHPVLHRKPTVSHIIYFQPLGAGYKEFNKLFAWNPPKYSSL